MPNPTDVLRNYGVHVPAWLGEIRAGDAFPHRQFSSSRVVYYPGSGTDGHPLKVFGGSHSAHCFVFADYRPPRTKVETQPRNADDLRHPRGYKPLLVEPPTESQPRPGGWRPHVALPRNLTECAANWATRRPAGGAYALWAILERREGFGDSHGPSRLALVFVGGEGVATFDALFCQGDAARPWAVVLQDHGFGGNWTRFGGHGSLLWCLAQQYARPEWIFVGRGTHPWPGYVCVSGADPGGMNALPRRLYRWNAID